MNTFDEIIQTKAYSDLTPNELEVIRELVSSEEEYNEMKSFYSGIDALAISGREEVSDSVKTSLNTVFQAKHPGISQNWNAPADKAEKKIIPLYNRTLFRAAALLVLAAGVISIWVSTSENQLETSGEKQFTANNKSLLHEEKEAVEQKKEFPLNAGNNKQFTAASPAPAKKPEPAPASVTSGESYSFPSDASKGSNLTSDKSSRSQAPVAATYYKSDGDSENLMKAGIDADLNPGGFYKEAKKDLKPAVKTTDLLSLIEPSF